MNNLVQTVPIRLLAEAFREEAEAAFSQGTISRQELTRRFSLTETVMHYGKQQTERERSS